MPHPVVYAVLMLGALWLGSRWFERVNMYFPSREFLFHPGTFGLSYEDVWLTAADGERLHGWFVPGEPKGPVLLFCHGNGGNISHRMDKLRIFHGLGASVLLFDYRGYGKSSGTPSERGTYLDAEAAWSHLAAARGIPQERIVLCGESLGGGVALELALRHPPRALILESAFTSTMDMGRLIFPWLPVRWLVRYRYDNLAKIPRLRCPVLVLHSPQDDIVPYEMGRRLYEAAPEPKEFFEMRGDHNEGFLTTGEDYPAALRRFLERHAASKALTGPSGVPGRTR